MPSRSAAWRALAVKELRELLVSRAWWILLILTGPLIGVSFISAVRVYGEASGVGGTSAGVGEAFSPLTGIWAPTFSAYEIVAVFLLPFVAIRLIAGDRQSGALKMELQRPLPAATRVLAKVAALAAGWIVASLPGLAAIVLWNAYGGSSNAAEIAAVLAGHALNAALTIALAAAAGSVTQNPSTAAILTLAVTIGSWVLNFAGDIHGGAWEYAAGLTPPAMVAQFQHGLIQLSVVLVAVVLATAGCALAAIWMRLGVATARRVWESGAVALAAAALIAVAVTVRASWDVSEDRKNSLPEPDEAALAQLQGPLEIEAHLAAEDPRRTDLERQALSKLRRALPELRVRYVAATSIGLFEQTAEHYGEIWYTWKSRRALSRATSAEGVLETIYGLTGIPPSVEREDTFRGHPLAASPRFAAAAFYLAWPALTMVAGLAVFRRLS